MRAALYARVSSRAQSERHTIKSQLSVLRAFIAGQGWELADEYIDDGRTARAGHLEKRDGFARLILDAEARRFDVVVVVDIDRLTRSEDMTERAVILGPFQRLGISIVTPSHGTLDLRTMLGEFQAQVYAMFAADENRKRSERTLAGKLRAVSENRPPAGPYPYGYRFDRATGWSIEPREAAIVREIFERVAAREPCSALDEDMRRRGLTRPRGGEWTKGRAARIVRASAYRGEWVVSKRRNQVLRLPPIVSSELWHAAQHAMDHTRGLNLRRTRHVYLLERLAVCELCGAPIYTASHGDTLEGRPVRPATYVCQRRLRRARGEPPCRLAHWKVELADPAVWDELRRALARPDLVEEAIATRAARAGDGGRTWERDIAEARRRLERLDAAQAAILARYRRGLVSDAAMDADLAAAARERALLERQVTTAQRAQASAVRAQGTAQELAAGLAAMRAGMRRASPEARQRIVRRLLGHAPVYVGPDGLRGMLGLAAERRIVRPMIHASWTMAHDADVREIGQLVVLRRAA